MRFVALALALLAGVVGFAPPAAADSDVSISVMGDSHTWAPVAGNQKTFQIHGPNWTEVEVLVDFSAIRHAADVTPVNSGLCSAHGSEALRCVMTTGTGGESFNIAVKAKAGAPLGVAGQVITRITATDGSQDSHPANNTVRTTVDVVDATSGAQVQVSAGAAKGQIGQSVTVSVTVRNNGPNSLRLAWIGNIIPQSGVKFLGYGGCVQSTDIACATPVITKGSSKTITLKLRIDGCVHPLPPIAPYERGEFPWSYVPGWGKETNDRNHIVRFTVDVAGCAAGPSNRTGSPGAGTTTDTATSDIPPTPTPAMPAEIQDIDTSRHTASADARPASQAQEARHAIRAPMWTWVAVLLLGLTGIAFAVWVRRNRPRTATEDRHVTQPPRGSGADGD